MGSADLPKMPKPPVHDPDFNSGDPKSVAKRQSRAEAEAMQHRNDVRSVLATVEGRRVVYDLLGKFGLYHDTFSTNALSMSNLSGMRKSALILLAEVEAADPMAFILMQQENITKEASNG
jgi:hypothetical protein